MHLSYYIIIRMGSKLIWNCRIVASVTNGRSNTIKVLSLVMQNPSSLIIRLALRNLNVFVKIDLAYIFIYGTKFYVQYEIL